MIYDLLGNRARLSPNKIGVVDVTAGRSLALWRAGRARQPPGQRPAQPGRGQG